MPIQKHTLTNYNTENEDNESDKYINYSDEEY